MTILGVRCSNRDFAYAILDGTKQDPQQIEAATLAYPKGFPKPQSLHWLFQEAAGLLQRHQVDKVVLKRFEGQSRGAPFEERVEHEAAIILAAADRGMRAVFKKVKSQIAKDLGQKGRARYLAALDTSKLATFDTLSDKERKPSKPPGASWHNGWWLRIPQTARRRPFR